MTSTLFDLDTLEVPRHDPNQPAQLARVRHGIASAVQDFHNSIKHGQTCHLSELSEYVKAQTGCNPNSPDRILRDLRQHGVLNYEVVSRTRSEYRSLPLTTGEGRG